MDAMIRRRMMMADSGGSPTPPTPVLPYDAEIEYLQSDGGQYILLGFTGAGYIDIDAVCLSTSSTTQVLVCSTSGATGGSWFGVPSNKDKWGVSTSILFSESYATRVAAEVHLIQPYSISVIINGVTKNRTGTTGRQQEWALMASNGGSFGFAGRIFACQCYSNDDHSLIGDFVPVRVGTVGYIYDRVRGQLFGNAGTGNFILGNDKNI